jgi:PHD/YefM family antitoxin component YafN of YafNO toxin-antitoxin module
VSIEELKEKAEQILDDLQKSPEPIAIMRDGEMAAYLIPADRFVVMDETVTPAEAEEIRAAIDEGEAEIDAGGGVPWEEAKARLQAKLKEQSA